MNDFVRDITQFCAKVKKIFELWSNYCEKKTNLDKKVAYHIFLGEICPAIVLLMYKTL